MDAKTSCRLVVDGLLGFPYIRSFTKNIFEKSQLSRCIPTKPLEDYIVSAPSRTHTHWILSLPIFKWATAVSSRVRVVETQEEKQPWLQEAVRAYQQVGVYR